MGPSLIALQCGRPVFNSWVGMIWRRGRLPTPVFLGFPGGSDGIESACNSGYLDLIPGSGRFPGKGIGKPLQYASLENSMDRGAWRLQTMGSQRVGQNSGTFIFFSSYWWLPVTESWILTPSVLQLLFTTPIPSVAFCPLASILSVSWAMLVHLV